MIYKAVATVNYPETKVETPDAECASIVALCRWVNQLMQEPDAKSFVITIVKVET